LLEQVTVSAGALKSDKMLHHLDTSFPFPLLSKFILQHAHHQEIVVPMLIIIAIPLNAFSLEAYSLIEIRLYPTRALPTTANRAAIRRAKALDFGLSGVQFLPSGRYCRHACGACQTCVFGNAGQGSSLRAIDTAVMFGEVRRTARHGLRQR
jgi:hypothetical protein